MGLSNDDDPYTGEIYESRDTRDGGRRIRIQERLSSGDEPLYRRVYRAKVVDVHGFDIPGTRRTRVSVHTLNTRYRKVSR